MSVVNSVKNFLRQEAVAIIAFLAAVISCLFVPVTNYMSYIDTDLIGVLFGLMAVVAGFSENNVFKVLSNNTVRFANNTRKLAFLLVILVFFMSMLITNDVALIAFVPFTVMLYDKIGKSPVYVIVLETIAANMGSAFTPVGNPQNLYLFSASGMSSSEFFGLTAQITAVSFILLVISVMFIKKEQIVYQMDDDNQIKIQNPRYLVLYAILFVLCLLTVFDKVQMIYVFASICVVFAIVQPVIFLKVDYGLLVTFASFFIFVGNIKSIPEVTEYISNIIVGYEFESAVICSQIISNVPAAVMLSAFSDNYPALILGTDIGGLGTLIASLASLISYKNYCRSEKASPRKFIAVFTLMNIIFLVILYLYSKIVIL